MKIAAVSDIHCPIFYDDFLHAMNNYDEDPDLFVLAGDMIDRGDVDEFKKVCNVLFGRINCPIVAVFGNNEYSQVKQVLKNNFRSVNFLDDESKIFEINGEKILATDFNQRVDENMEARKSKNFFMFNSFLKIVIEFDFPK